jgi:hypothetical protein
MKEKIHCDLLELFGPNWKEFTSDNINRIAGKIHKQSQLFGEEPNLYGFVGTRRDNNIVGGYFAIQYSEEEFHYDKHKNLSKIQNHPFVRMLFVLFISSGKVLLQNTKFSRMDLTMPMALNLFKEALNSILIDCKLYPVTNIELAPEEVTKEDFITAFQKSDRVTKLIVFYPDGTNIPIDYIYYNPQKERNEIIRDSHTHDYANLKKVDLEASELGDVKKTHLRDIILAGKPQIMNYFINMESFTLRQYVRRKYEFYIDKESDQISEQELSSLIEMLRKERAVYLDTPTNEKPNHVSQLGLFSEDNEEDE